MVETKEKNWKKKTQRKDIVILHTLLHPPYSYPYLPSKGCFYLPTRFDLGGFFFFLYADFEAMEDVSISTVATVCSRYWVYVNNSRKEADKTKEVDETYVGSVEYETTATACVIWCSQTDLEGVVWERGIVREVSEPKETDYVLPSPFMGGYSFHVCLMECYKDEALRAKEIAEKKFLANDISDFNGEKDWYALLGTDQTADEETIRKRYRKLALQLHPDKNKSVGAEGAFQFISQAWSVLSDKNRRMIYDHKRFGGGFHQKSPTAANTTAAAAAAAAAAPKGQLKKTKPAPTKSSAATFWTSCSTCKCCCKFWKG